MTVATQIDRSGPYAGAGTTGPFTVSFRFLDATHLQVIRTDGTGQHILTLTTDYTVAGVGNPTGSVTLVTALPVGQTLTIIRKVPKTQEADYVQNSDFPAESHEDALDKLTMIAQETGEVVARAITLPTSDSSLLVKELPIAALRANKAVVFGPDGSVGVSIDDYNNQAANAAASAAAAAASAASASSSANSAAASYDSFDDRWLGPKAADPTLDNDGNALLEGAAYWNIGGSLLKVWSVASATWTAINSFVQSGVGAVTRTWQDKVRGLDINAEDFGVVADGATDDSAAFEKSINASGGKKLLLPVGTPGSPRVIKITRPLVITTGVAPSLIGGGADRTTIKLVAASLASDAIPFVGTPRGMKITGIKFDQNGVATTLTCGILSLQNPEDLEVSYCEFIGWDKLGLSLNGARRFDIHHNRIERTAASSSYNQAFLLSSSSRASTNGRFSHNVCVRSALNFDGSVIEISDNEVSLWQFGAGVTTEQSANSSHYEIRNNRLYGSSGIDVNSYRCGGIENWGAYSTIIGNKCYNNSGSGIDQGGHHSYVAGNYCYNNGTSGTPGSVAGGDGIVSRYGDATYNANYSTYVGNFCIDTQGSKTQGYGYSDQSASLSAITMRGNKFGAHLTGTELIQSSVMDHDAPILELTYTENPPSLAAGARYAVAQTFANAVLGDYVSCSFSLDLQEINLYGYVKANNTIAYVFDNRTAGTIDLASGTVRVRVVKQRNYPAFI